MRWPLSILSMLIALLVCMADKPAEASDKSGRSFGHSRKFGQHHGISRGRLAAHGFRHGHGSGHKFGHGFGHGVGFGFFGGAGSDFWGYADLYRELYNNLPYFALHPPVYYSYPVPRTYGYSPFAYPPYVMTPDPHCEAQPLEIINPHVPKSQENPAEPETERAVKAAVQPEPLVIVNPFVTPRQSVAQQR
jgi:hypothetical protein